MKQKLQIIVFLILINCSYFSCTNSIEKPINDSKLIGDFQLNFTNPDKSSITFGDMFLQGAVYWSDDTNHTSLDAGKLLISNLELNYTNYDSILMEYVYGYSYSGYYSDMPVKPEIGGIGTWGITGNSANSIKEFIVQLYTPKLPKITEPISNFATVSKNGFTIKWEADIDNDSILIVTNIPRDSTLPDLGYIFFSDHGWYVRTADNGEIHIDKEQLSSFKINDTLSIGLYRIHYDTVNTKDINFKFKRNLNINRYYNVK